MSIDYGCAELPEHEIDACGNHALGGIDAIGILSPEHTITDFTDATQLQSAIDAGLLKIIKEIQGEVAKPSPKEVDSLRGSGPSTQLSSFERPVTWMDGNATPGNVDFYNTLNKRKDYLITYQSTAGTIRVYQPDGGCAFVCMLVIPKDNQARQYWDCQAKFNQLAEAPIYDAPIGIFE